MQIEIAPGFTMSVTMTPYVGGTTLVPLAGLQGLRRTVGEFVAVCPAGSAVQVLARSVAARVDGLCTFQRRPGAAKPEDDEWTRSM